MGLDNIYVCDKEKDNILTPILYDSITFKEFSFLHGKPGTVFLWGNLEYRYTVGQLSNNENCMRTQYYHINSTPQGGSIPKYNMDFSLIYKEKYTFVVLDIPADD